MGVKKEPVQSSSAQILPPDCPYTHKTSQAAPFQEITSKLFYKAPWDKNNSTSTHCVSTELQISTGSLN